VCVVDNKEQRPPRRQVGGQPVKPPELRIPSDSCRGVDARGLPASVRVEDRPSELRRAREELSALGLAHLSDAPFEELCRHSERKLNLELPGSRREALQLSVLGEHSSGNEDGSLPDAGRSLDQQCAARSTGGVLQTRFDKSKFLLTVVELRR
jgi:hypothetical protein